MLTLLVMDDPKDWPLDIPGVELRAARNYLVQAEEPDPRGTRVVNLCRSYRYQTAGYYVSLLAAARGHRPFPALEAVLDMRSRGIIGIVDNDQEELVEKTLANLSGQDFELLIYFGRTRVQKYARLGTQLFNLFPAPLLRARFSRRRSWHLTGLQTVGARGIPERDREFVLGAAEAYLSRPGTPARRRRTFRWDLALLVDPKELLPPSDDRALARFSREARKLGIQVEQIDKEDEASLGQYDALFIRETTAINHHTFRFAQRAEKEGLAVIDDPLSILRCTNKVYLAELLDRCNVPTPKTVIGHRSNLDTISAITGFPCVLKYPDSSFSQGVVRADNEEQLELRAREILNRSDLLVAQEFFPTDFDWRVGVLDGEPLYACRYHMAKGHWQIVKKQGEKRYRYGKVEPVPVDAVPSKVMKMGVRAARLVGDGLYGVDLKEQGKHVVVMEVNDNPNLNAGCEDAVLGAEMYRRIAQAFLRRIEALRGGQT
jgi:glutathione synthase/RimK-type ligase-like ATP-grasp enzyme